MNQIKMSKKMWESIGKKAGWMQKEAVAQVVNTLPAQVEIVVGGNYPITANLVINNQKIFLNPNDPQFKNFYAQLNADPNMQKAIGASAEQSKQQWQAADVSGELGRTMQQFQTNRAQPSKSYGI